MSNIAASLLDILGSVRHIGSMFGEAVEQRLSQLRAAVRAEVRCAAKAIGMAIIAAACGFAALAFGAIAILIAAWPTHPVLAAALIALGFALLAVFALIVIRSCTR